MKHKDMTIKPATLTLTALLMLGCSEERSVPSTPQPAAPQTHVATKPTAQASKQGIKVLTAEESVRDVVATWDTAHTVKDGFGGLYSPNVLFYGAKLSSGECIEKKSGLLAKGTFKQEIRGKLDIHKVDNGLFRVEFTKVATIGGKISEYPSYLEIMKTGDQWRITTEGDAVTDAKLKRGDDWRSSSVLGDFNGDGKTEVATVTAPKIVEDDECEGECTCTISFSDKSIPSISHEMCVGGRLNNEGDLNGDGSDELGMDRIWFRGRWSSYFVYSPKLGAEHLLVPAIMTEMEQWGMDIRPIRKHPSRPGYVIIQRAVMGVEPGPTHTTEVVKLP